MLHLPLLFGSNPLVDSENRVKGRRRLPSKGWARVVLSARGGQSARWLRKVCEEATDQVFILFLACSCEFPVCSVSQLVFVARSSWMVRKSVRRFMTRRMVRGSITDGPFFWVLYWWFGLHFWMVHHVLADRPPGSRRRSAPSCGQSAWGFAKCLSSLLLELCFRFGLSWDLFLGLVGPLWLRDLGKLMWESLVFILGLSRLISRNSLECLRMFYSFSQNIKNKALEQT
jgi:hypothetical protein